MDLGLKEGDVEYAIECFKKTFTTSAGKNCDWFLKIVNAVRRLKKRGTNVTDVLLREGTAPLVGIVKDFYFVDELNEIRVSKEEIREFVRILLEKSERGMDFVDFSVGKRKSIDFSMSMYGCGIFRINYSQDVNGDTLNVRVLDFELPDFDDLKFPEMYHRFFKQKLLMTGKINVKGRELIKRRISRGGLILHAGETGSGKTTSIASELKFLTENTDGIIITYEDPVEYRFIPTLYPRVRQIEIYRHIYPEEIFRHFLRNSPSVGMIGEIRTREEYFNVLNLAGRGHLVITTLHARNVVESLYSFLNVVGNENRDLFFGVLRAVVCHKLYLNKVGTIVPFYEILIIDGTVRSVFLKDSDFNFAKINNYLYKEYKESLVNKGVFYSFEHCLMDRIREELVISEEEKAYLKNWIESEY